MKRKWKILILVALLLLIAGGVFAGIKMSQRGIVTVQTGKSTKQDLVSLVTASGEIKPRNYINIGANVQGPLTAIYVKEGDKVKKGQVLATIESIQAGAAVNAQQAALNSALADSAAGEASLRSYDDNIVASQAGVERTKADLEQKRLDWERADKLFQDKLIARQEYDSKKALYESQVAAVREAESKLQQARSQRAQAAAQLTSAQKKVTQQQATLVSAGDVLNKHNAIAPLDGVVTNLPVRMGETVVPGIQNSQASTIMTIADMSIITAELKVDETDIVNVKMNQTADVTIDAIPNKTFKGHVIEIGNTALLRSTGVAASQSQTSSQEAKDFKVVIALENPAEEIRPGLSCTAKITTATRNHVLAVPIQALTVRQRGDLETANKKTPPNPNQPRDPAAEKARKEEIQGVFIVNGERAEFHKVETGITGATDIEVLNGLKEGDQIVTGSYQVIRTLKNSAKIKVDNKAPAPAKT